MSDDQKIDEILQIVKSEQVLNNNRFTEVSDLIKSEQALNNNRFTEVSDFLKSERTLNNSRFVQLSTGLLDVQKKIDLLGTELKQEIRQNYSTLSEDGQAFAEDLDKVKRRVSKIERKIA